MRFIRLVGLFSILCSVGCAAMGPQGPPWRPCGAGNSWGGNWLVPQGSYGADFRAACMGHDACYANRCSNRLDCDNTFLNNMYAACENSYNPQACQQQAQFYYMNARMFGGLYWW